MVVKESASEVIVAGVQIYLVRLAEDSVGYYGGIVVE